MNTRDKGGISHQLRETHIELYKLLKIEGLADTGGTAKNLIADGQVKVNGQVETRKRYKAKAGDRVEVFDDVVLVE
ncbi:MAG: RNA-binding S4 domain-containing protein [Pseudomonadota bacterium]